jgi:hypothetical protein
VRLAGRKAYPTETTERGSTDVTRATAVAAFRDATGRDIDDDAEIRTLMMMLRLGLNEAVPEAKRLEARPGKGFETVYVRPTRRPGPGRDPRPRNMIAPIATLVDLLGGPKNGAKNAALAVALFELHRHPGLGCSLAPPGPRLDVGHMLRTVANHLQRIAKDYVPLSHIENDKRAALDASPDVAQDDEALLRLLGLIFPQTEPE